MAVWAHEAAPSALPAAMSLRPRVLPAGFVAPCLPTNAPQPPSGELWLHEMKHDGFLNGEFLLPALAICITLDLMMWMSWD